MKVPFGDMKVHYQAYKAQIDGAVQRVLESGHYILGPELDQFEKEFANFLGSGFVAGCASGTEAIYLALAACDVGPGDEILVVAHTAVPTISAISMAGATPVFIDLDPSSYVMDTTLLEAKVTAKTKVIIPVHLYGQVVDMDAVMAVAAKHNLKVLEDVAQATGAQYKGKTVGTIGDFGAFSFYPSKNLGAFGDGGAVSTKTKENFDRLVMLRNYGQSKRYHHDIIGINSRLDEMQAAILAAQIPYVAEWNLRRREIAKRYTEGLKDVVQTPVENDFGTHVYHLYVIQTPHRDDLQNYLMDRGIGTLIHYPIPAHLQKAYSYLGYQPNSLPVTEQLAKRILSLPLFPELTNEQVDEVIKGIRDFCAEPASAAKLEKAQAR
ncbi:MAG TPA: DegT/DnrJ/EryC1/StrS family aminotransferase [Drouetiella sp.]